MNWWIALSQSVFEWAWQNSIYATLLFVLVVALQKILARWLTPRLRYTLGLLVLIRLLLPIAPSSVLSFENAVPQMAALASRAASLPVSGQPAEVAITIRPHDLSSPPGPAWLPFRISLSAVSCIVWASGLLCLFFLARWRLGQWHRLIKNGRRISDPKLLALLNSSRQAMGVRRPVELVAIAQLSSPAVFGLWKTRLLLPETASSQLTDDELRLIFLHEMAHLRRNDVPLNFLLMTVQFLHWFNPLVWLAFHRLRADQELVCDAMVMQKLRPGERLGYGKVLLKLMDGFPAAIPGFSGAVPVISSLTEIRRRLLMIKNHRQATIAACIVTALAVLALAVGVFTHAPRQRFPRNLTPPVMAEFQKGGPHYHSQPLGYWTVKLKQGNLHEQAQAQEALRSLGQKAVPFLLQYLATVDLGPQWRAYAASALGEIGPEASNAIPALLQMTNEPFLIAASQAALMKIKGEPIDQLIRSLDDPISEQWVITAQTLAEFGPKAEPAIPALCRALNSEKGWAAAYAIAFIHSDPEIAVPALIETLKLGDSMKATPEKFASDEATRHLYTSINKGNIIWALGQFGADASSAVPIIRLSLVDTDPMVRQSALLSLRKILPREEAKTLVPALLQNVTNADPNLSGVAQGMLQEIDPRAAKKAGVAE